jgi:hypothetical protein
MTVSSVLFRSEHCDALVLRLRMSHPRSYLDEASSETCCPEGIARPVFSTQPILFLDRRRHILTSVVEQAPFWRQRCGATGSRQTILLSRFNALSAHATAAPCPFLLDHSAGPKVGNEVARHEGSWSRPSTVPLAESQTCWTDVSFGPSMRCRREGQ